VKYFSIHNSLDERITGKLPQVKEVVHNCHVWDDPNFIDRFPFKKIETVPILSNAVLFAEAEQTDLIETGGIGFSYGSMLISNRLKNLLEKHKCHGVQFFPASLIHKNKKIENYWQSHIYDIPYGFLDFDEIDLLLKDRDENGKPIKRYLERMGKDDFLNLKESLKYPKMLFLKNLSFNEEMDLDYFFLPNMEGTGYGIVSERLRKEMDKQNINGIEFKPIEVELNNWLGPHGLRKDIYGKT
tara:strand:- start:397 stop:1122 length:726 start_codon:yes stop_codon:yes gene_type:complete